MTILNFRIIVLLVMLCTIAISTLMFFLRKNPVIKMINLAFTYLLIIAFFVYLITVKQFEDILFPVCIIIFMSFILTFLTGISVVNNLLNKDEEEENVELD